MVEEVGDVIRPGAHIKVIGVGGGGSNAINTMISAGVESVGFVAANTDMQSLSKSLSPVKIQVGKELTKGLGAGADPDVGRDATLEDRHEIMEAVGDADMVFVTAGMGGGTGTGGAAVVAQIARELGALTVGVVTKPFAFEGRRRARHAEIGIERLRENVDTLLVIPNERLLETATPDMSLLEAFKTADHVLLDAVRGISDIINIPGTVNVDFADVKTVMSQMGRALMGIGLAQGEGRAASAAQAAISSPLLDNVDIEGATGVLINITASPSVGILELNEACSVIHEAAHEEANIIMGAVIDEQMQDNIRVTVIATGFPSEQDASLSPPSLLTSRKSVLSNMHEELRAFQDPQWGRSRQAVHQKERRPQARPMQERPLRERPTPIVEPDHSPAAALADTPLQKEEALVEPASSTEVLIHGDGSHSQQAPASPLPQVDYAQEGTATRVVEDIPLATQAAEQQLAQAPQVSYSRPSGETEAPSPVLSAEQPEQEALQNKDLRVGASAFHEPPRVSPEPEAFAQENSGPAEAEEVPPAEQPLALSEDVVAPPEEPLSAAHLAADVEDSIDSVMFLAGGAQSEQESTDIDVPTFLRGQVKPKAEEPPSSS